ncbi:hypothetical protein [Rhizobium lentis]|uniref:hypothetical protein n=1 Tax=Rhizobium lentis TaxID=1138194 RepID=UPI001C8342FE|nr:hypothetical protein [Rhizobium lentis]MBX4997602.1 hypothetical protein [Rhizobium lentis]MBX5014817.1 hypothetical protein [Rhizobium lentis]
MPKRHLRHSPLTLSTPTILFQLENVADPHEIILPRLLLVGSVGIAITSLQEASSKIISPVPDNALGTMCSSVRFDETPQKIHLPGDGCRLALIATHNAPCHRSSNHLLHSAPAPKTAKYLVMPCEETLLIKLRPVNRNNCRLPKPQAALVETGDGNAGRSIHNFECPRYFNYRAINGRGRLESCDMRGFVVAYGYSSKIAAGRVEALKAVGQLKELRSREIGSKNWTVDDIRSRIIRSH